MAASSAEALQTVNEAVDKVDESLESVGLTGVKDNIKELLDWKDYLKEQFPSIVGFGLRVVLAIVIFFVGCRIIRWAMRVLKKSLKKTRMDEGGIQFICSAGKWGLYLLLVFNIAINLGVKESSVAALMGTLGVTVGLGLQGALSNLAGGVLLLLFKPFVVGDYIVQDQSGGVEGTVSQIEMCYTTLLTFDNKKIVVPNGSLSNSTIINVTAKENRKLEIKVGISYKSDIKKAREILKKILLEDPDTQGEENGIQIFVDSLGENSVILGLQVWVPTGVYFPTKWRVNERIKEEFEAGGIEIAYNQMDVYVHQRE